MERNYSFKRYTEIKTSPDGIQKVGELLEPNPLLRISLQEILDSDWMADTNAEVPEETKKREMDAQKRAEDIKEENELVRGKHKKYSIQYPWIKVERETYFERLVSWYVLFVTDTYVLLSSGGVDYVIAVFHLNVLSLLAYAGIAGWPTWGKGMQWKEEETAPYCHCTVSPARPQRRLKEEVRPARLGAHPIATRNLTIGGTQILTSPIPRSTWSTSSCWARSNPDSTPKGEVHVWSLERCPVTGSFQKILLEIMLGFDEDGT